MADTLFGMTAEDLQAQQQATAQAQAMRFAQMRPAEQAAYGGYMAGNQLGGALGGMLGAKDPQLEKATIVNRLAAETDMNDLESVKALVGKLNQAGATREAMSLLPRIDALEKASEDRKVKLEAAKAKGTSKDPSLTGEERMAKFVAEIQDKLDQGVEVSSKDLNQAKMYAEILRKQKTITDKAGNILGIDQRSVPSLGSAPTGAVTGAPSGPVKPLGQTPEGKKTEAEAAEKKTTGKLINQLDFQSDIANIDTALARTSKWSTGFGAWLSGIPETEAMALDDVVGSIKSGQFLGNLKALKEASATGASGLGSVTEKEGAKVEAKVRALNPKSKTFVKDLEYIRDYMQKLQDIKEGKQVEGQSTSVNKPPSTAPTAAPTGRVITDALIQRVIDHNKGRASREQAIQMLKGAGYVQQ